MKIMCRVCSKLVPRIPAEKIKNTNGYYYRNLEGRRWHGFRCPDCHASAAKSRHRKEKIPSLRMAKTTRKCRACSKALPPSRYFKHIACDWLWKRNEYAESIWTPEDWGCGVVDGVTV